jgi:hypothetical protein
MRWFYFFAAGFLLASAPPSPAQESTQAPLASVKLTDGRVLHDVQINGTLHDYVVVKCQEGAISVPYEAFPPDLRAKLEAVRPKREVKVLVRGDADATIGSTGPGAASARPAGPQNLYYPGRIFLAGSTPAGTPLPAVLVYAVRTSDWAAYNQARLKQHGAEIDAAADKMVKAAPGDARRAAITDTLLTIYASFDPPPPALGVGVTDDNGRFTVTCHDLQVVLVARATVKVGDSYRYMVWAETAVQGEPTFLTNENAVTR